ncbi:MAG: hypothetical protein AAF639_06185 [Chloroflexota bacterium]
MYTDIASSDNGTHSQNGAQKSRDELVKIAPTDKLVDELWAVAEQRNGRAYRRLMKQLDWTVASEEQITKAIGITLGYVDSKQADYLSQIAIERFPNSQPFANVRKLFEKPTVRRIKRTWPLNTPGALKASAAWIREHNDDYEIGHWLAVKNGELIADAPTRNEFNQIIDSLGGPEILANDTIIHKVIS